MSAEDSDEIAKPPVYFVHRSSRGHLFGLLILLLVIAASLAWVAIRNNRTVVSPPKPAHLLFVDPDKHSLTFTDASDKSLFKVPYPPNAYINYEGVTPSGSSLLSLSITSQNEGYIFTKNNGQTQTLADSAIKVLRSSIVLDSSHQLFFTSEDTVLLVTCPAEQSCKLISLNILTGENATIVDTGIKKTSALVPAYLLGTSGDYKIAYLRTIGKGTLSKSPGALYQIDLKTHKSIKETDVSQNIDYSLKLSPDKEKLVYKTGGYTTATTLHILNLKTHKDTTAKWTNGEIADQPSAFTWSPDSSKVLFHTLDIVLPPGVTSSLTALTAAYLDTTKMAITNLQTVNDPSHHNIVYQGWVDDHSIVYQLAASVQPYDFTNTNLATYNQNVSTKQSTKIQSYGQLDHAIYW